MYEFIVNPFMDCRANPWGIEMPVMESLGTDNSLHDNTLMK